MKRNVSTEKTLMSYHVCFRVFGFFSTLKTNNKKNTTFTCDVVQYILQTDKNVYLIDFSVFIQISRYRSRLINLKKIYIYILNKMYKRA